jgi:hypothetical protein
MQPGEDPFVTRDECWDPGPFGPTLQVTSFDTQPAFIKFDLEGGNTQQCSQTGGRMVTVTADYFVKLKDLLERISWKLNDEDLGGGDSIDLFAPAW